MKHFYLTLCLLLLSLGAWAGTTPATGTTPKAAAEPTIPALEKPLPAPRPLAPEGWEALALQQMEALVAAQPLELQQRRFEEFSVAAPLAVDVMVEGPMYSSGTPLDSVQFYIAKARAVIDKIRSTGNFIKNFDAKTQVELPVGISKTIGGLEYTVGIDSIRLLPTHAEFDAYMEFTLPQNGKTLTFMGKGIKFTKSGGIVGDARLELLTDYAINFPGDKGQLVLKGTFGPGQGTFVRVSCDGFEEMGLQAEVVFSRELFVPEGLNGQPLPQGRVSSSFTTSLSDWNDLVLELSLPPFQVPKLKGVGFTVRQAVFDFSDRRNVPGVKFPPNYAGLEAYGDTPELWRGFYLRELSIRLPKEFKDKTKDTRTTFSGYDMLIDNMGFTGTLVATNLISRDNGSMGSWAFSLDSVYIDLLANQLQMARFGGDIVLPPAKDNPLAYRALYDADSGNYLFTVTPTKDMDFNLWGQGKINLLPTSYLEVRGREGEFVPKAVLHGSMSLTASFGESSGPKASLADIQFQDLQLTTRGQRVRIGALSLSTSQNSFSNFPIQLTEIGAVSQGNELGLRVGIKLNLMKASDEGFAADGRLIVWGEVDTTAAIQERWAYKRLEVSELGIDVKKKDVFELHGRVVFYRGDATYGNGFRGTLDAKLGGIGVEAMALFGNVEGMRYWYADALATFGNTGIPLTAGLNAYGFGGGAYYQMRQQGFTNNTGSTLGVTKSGIVYAPSDAVKMGFKATVSLGATKKEAFNGDATFEISINQHGGINQIGFLGNIYVMTADFGIDVEKMKAASKVLAESGGKAPEADAGRAQVSGQVNLLYDHTNRVFHGDLNVFVNAAGGLVRGVGANNRAGWAVIHFAPDTWYVHVGSPSDPIGLKMMGVFQTASYFMVGHEIPGSPPPPARVSDILGGMDLDYMRDMNALGNGQGFAFGAHLQVSTGEKKFLIFYGSFDAGAGLDIMVKDYGDAECAGRSGPIGINGWYANGQAYAYLEGKVGIEVNLRFKKGRFEIMEIGAAAVLQAKGPNPFWMNGIVGGRYNILGGLVKGSCKFEVTIGEECRIMNGNPLSGVEVIAALTPEAGSSEASVFNNPQAVFNLAVNQPFEMEDEGGLVRTYRVKLDFFRVLEGKNPLQGELEWNDDHTVLAFVPYEVLPGTAQLMAEAQVSFEERRSSGWQAVLVNGQKFTDYLSSSFTTGERPDHIPMSNIAWAYPLPQQYNYYREESPAGFVKLKSNQAYLFENTTDWEYVVQFKGEGTAAGSSIATLSYDAGNKQVNYSLPQNLVPGQYYSFELYSRPREEAGAVDQNIKKVDRKIEGGQQPEGTEILLATKEAEGTLDQLQENTLLSYRLRASQYATFKAKVEALEKNRGWMRPLYDGVDELGQTYWGEPFDQYELQGTPWGGAPLVRLEAKLPNTHWERVFLSPDVYRGYPLASWAVLTHSGVARYGVPPVRAVYLRQPQRNLLAPESSGSLGVTSVEGAFMYDLPRAVATDFSTLRSILASHQANGGILTPSMRHVLEARWLPILDGDYPIRVYYTLPGTEQEMSGTTTTPHNPIKVQ